MLFWSHQEPAPPEFTSLFHWTSLVRPLNSLTFLDMCYICSSLYLFSYSWLATKYCYRTLYIRVDEHYSKCIFPTLGHSVLLGRHLINVKLIQYPILPLGMLPAFILLLKSYSLPVDLSIWANNFCLHICSGSYHIFHLNNWDSFLTGVPITYIFPCQYIYIINRVIFLKLRLCHHPTKIYWNPCIMFF
jgi:hypothetical protein